MIPKTLLITNRANIQALSGFTGTAGTLLVDGKKGFLFTDARYHLVAQRVLPKHIQLVDVTKLGFFATWKKFLATHKKIAHIGIEESDMSVHFWRELKKVSGKTTFVDVSREVSEKRIVKRPEEIILIKKAQQITDRVFSELIKKLRIGQSEKQIAWMIEELAHECGADGLSFPSIIGINENSASPHHHVSDKKLTKGALILIDMGVSFKGYCSDMTRMLFTKAPTHEQEEVYECVRLAQQRAAQKVRAGTTGVLADQYAREVIAKAGYEKYFTHSLGHGVGLEVHELPNLSSRYTGILPAGCVVTLEPGIYLDGNFGVRIEDMVVVTKTGTECITKSPKSLKESIIQLR